MYPTERTLRAYAHERTRRLHAEADRARAVRAARAPSRLHRLRARAAALLRDVAERLEPAAPRPAA